MISARVRGAVHEKGYPNDGGDLNPESRQGGGRTEGWANKTRHLILLQALPVQGFGLHPHEIIIKPATLSVSTTRMAR